MSSEDATKALQSSAEWLNTIVLFALGITAIVLLLKVVQQRKIVIGGVTMALESVWIVFVALTIGHGMTTIIHLKTASVIMYDSSGIERNDPVRMKVWQAISTGGPLVFRNIVQRARVGTLSFPDLAHPLKDPLAIPSYVSAIAFFTANVHWRGKSRRQKTGWIFAAMFLTATNWAVASLWVFGTLELSGSRSGAYYLAWFS